MINFFVHIVGGFNRHFFWLLFKIYPDNSGDPHRHSGIAPWCSNQVDLRQSKYLKEGFNQVQTLSLSHSHNNIYIYIYILI